MDDSGINLGNEFDIAKFLDDDIDYEQIFQQSEAILFSHPPDQHYYEIKSKTVDSSSPPTFKTATPTTRTHKKQLLMKEKALDEIRREHQQKLREEQQKQEQERSEKQKQEAESKTQEKQTRPYPKVPQNVGVHFDVPSQVFKVKTVLENPTQYHVVQKQRMQLRQYLDEMYQRRSSLPISEASSLPPTQTPAPPVLSLPPTQTPATPVLSLPPHTTSLPLAPAPSPSPDVAMSPGLSSVATSASEEVDNRDGPDYGGSTDNAQPGLPKP